MVNTSLFGSTTSRYSPFQWISRRPSSQNIVARHEPPGRRSIETLAGGTSHSLPPNQSAKRSGSVHSFQTSSGDAAKTRVIVTPATPLSEGVCSGILRSSLGRLQTLVEAVQGALPEQPVLV